MKKVLLIVAAILLANAVSAQNYEKNILGVRAGLNQIGRAQRLNSSHSV